jgi:hypothetical protein
MREMLGLCKNDPIVDTLRGVFGANIVRVPDSRVKPLVALAVKDDKTTYWGELGDLLAGGEPPELAALPAAPSRMADIAGKRSSQVSAEIGLNILDGFLRGFGIPSAGIKAKFSSAKKVSFTFGDVQRRAVSPAAVGNILDGKAVDPDGPATELYFGDDPYALVVVDSVITSSDFTISVDESKEGSAGIDVPAIQAAVADVKAEVAVSSSSSTAITFKGEEHLTFAFTALRFYLDADGRIKIVPAGTDMQMFLAPGNAKVRLTPNQFTSDEFAMMEFENPPDAVPLEPVG